MFHLMIKMFYIVTLSLLTIAHVNSKDIAVDTCDKTTYICLKAKLEYMLATKNFADVDIIIKLLKESDSELALKENLLGIAYILKRNEKSYALAKQYLEAALQKGVLAAATNLAELYFIKKDYGRSMYYLDIAKKEGFTYPDPKYIKWAILYAQNVAFSLDSSEAQKNKSLEMMLQILDKDDSGSIQYILGVSSLQNGDTEVALKHFNISAEKNFVEAFVILGIVYYQGSGVDKNIETAKKYFEKASQGGSGQAAFNLATIAIEEKKHDEAKRYIVLSANRGYKKGVELYNELVNQ